MNGTEFVARYLRHVLPLGLSAIRRYVFCHPSAKAIGERLALHTGGTIVLETAPAATAPRPAPRHPNPLRYPLAQSQATSSPKHKKHNHPPSDGL